MVEDGLPRWKVGGEIAPWAAGAQHVEDRIENGPQRVNWRSATFGQGREITLQALPLRIRKIAGITCTHLSSLSCEAISAINKTRSNKITITHTISGTNAGTVTKTEEYQPGKALWDWLQLLGVLAIPVVVGFGAIWFTTRQGKVADAENKDNQRETALQAYIDKMSELLLHEHLSELLLDEHVGETPFNPQVVNIALARTATVLRILDKDRRGSLIRFLSQAGILAKCIEDELVGIDLIGANLSKVNLDKINLEKANLQGANLREASLQGTNLAGANLRGAILLEADLQGARLDGADLQGARLVLANLQRAVLLGTNMENVNLFEAEVTQEQLKQAKSLKGATIPDGSIHP